MKYPLEKIFFEDITWQGRAASCANLQFYKYKFTANVYLHFACRWDTVGTGAVKVYIASIFIIAGASPKMCI